MKKILKCITYMLMLTAVLLVVMAVPVRAARTGDIPVYSESDFNVVSYSSYHSLDNNATYILQNDVKLSEYLYVGSGITATIDLAGHTLDRGLLTTYSNGMSTYSYTSDGHVIGVHGGTLILKDSVGGGKITGGASSHSPSGGAGGIYVWSGTFQMEGGIITGNDGKTNNGSSTGVAGVYTGIKTFKMSGGIIESHTYLHEAVSGGIEPFDGVTAVVTYSNTSLNNTEESSSTIGLRSGNVSVKTKRTVTLNANGGSVSTTSTTITYGSAVGTLPTPSRSGYNFDGWFTAESGGTQVTSSSTAWGASWTGTYYAHWTANPATVVTNPTAKSLTYNGSAQALVNEGTADNGSMYYKLAGGSYSTSVPTAKNAGTYTVYYQAQGTGGNSSEKSLSVTIAKAALTIGTIDKSITYGDKVPAYEKSVSGLKGSDSLTLTFTCNYAPTSDAGRYTITPAVASESEATAKNYSITKKNGTLTVDKKEIGISWGGTSFTYDGTEKLPTAGATGMVNGDVLTLTVEGAETDANAEGESYTATVKKINGDKAANYKLPSNASTGFKIDRAEVDMSGAVWEYSDPSFTYDGNEKSVRLTGLPDGVRVESYSENSKTDAGSYTASAVLSYEDTDNYKTPTVGDCTWTIERRDIAGAEVSLGGELIYTGGVLAKDVTDVAVDGLDVTYDVKDNTATDAGDYILTVEGRGNFTGTVTAEWSIAKRDITDADITLAALLTYNGREQTQELAGITADGVAVTGYTVDGNSGTDTGDYELTVTGTDNFKGSCSTNWSIARKNVAGAVITLDSSELIYNGKAQTKAVEGVMIDGLTPTFNISGDTGTDAGDYTVTITGTGNFTGEESAAWSIARAPLTVSANDLTVTKGDEPVFSVTYEGFIPGEDESVISGLSYACEYPALNPGAGIYVITPQGATAANYNISFIPGTLTVKDTYAVTYYRNYTEDDAEVITAQTKIEDSKLTLSLPELRRRGYIFEGWFTGQSEGIKQTEAVYTGNAPLDLYAKWTPISYIIRFNANGGAGSMADMALRYDEAQELNANTFTRSAFNFVGWAASPDGAVEWTDGVTVQNLSATENDIVVFYAIWTAKPVYQVSGNVLTSEGEALPGVTVRLMRGTEKIATAVTSEDGSFLFDAPADTYNIVAVWQKDEDNEVTKTQLVVLDSDMSCELTMPSGNTNSLLNVVGSDTPPVVVGGLDLEAEAVREAEEDIEDTKKVTVVMTVESKDEEEIKPDADAIKGAAGDKILDYLSISVEKDVDGDKSDITMTANVLEIVVPYDFGNKQNVAVYRCHENNAAAMAELTSKPDDDNPAVDGTFLPDLNHGLIYIYAQKFSTYAIGYEEIKKEEGTDSVTVTLPGLLIGTDGSAADAVITMTAPKNSVSYNGRKHISSGQSLSKKKRRRYANDLDISVTGLPGNVKFAYVYKNNLNASSIAYYYIRLYVDRKSQAYRSLTKDRKKAFRKSVRQANLILKRAANHVYFTILPVDLSTFTWDKGQTTAKRTVFTKGNGDRIIVRMKKSGGKKVTGRISVRLDNKTMRLKKRRMQRDMVRNADGSYSLTLTGKSANYTGSVTGTVK